jgi:hypothetical protein
MAERKVLGKFRGVDVTLIVEGRISDEKREEGLHYYAMRHGDDSDWSTPVRLEKGVLVNFYGTMVTLQPIDELENSTDQFPEIFLTKEDVKFIWDNQISEYAFNRGGQ